LNATQQKNLPMRLSKYHRRWLYTVCGALVASGVGWLIAHYLPAEPGPFGEVEHPSEPWWLRLHGAAMMGFLVVLGTILPGHVRQAWTLRKMNAASVKRNVTTGILMLSLVGGLAVTGYLLYYCGSEELRPYLSTCHWVTGLAATFGFYQHHRSRARRNSVRTVVPRFEPPVLQPPHNGVGHLEPASHTEPASTSP
jgi:hypothetical protein